MGPQILFRQIDEGMLKLLEPYKEKVRNATKKPIGTTKVELEASDKVCRLKECNMMNLITDSFLNFYAVRNSTNPEDWSDVNAAIVNSGVTRTTIKQGKLPR